MTIPRVLFQGGQNAALRVSLPGWDVTSADIDHLVFNSSYSGLSIVQRGSTYCSRRGSATVLWTVAQEHIPNVLWGCKFLNDLSSLRYFGPYIYYGLNNSDDYIQAIATAGYITFSVYQLGVDDGCVIDYVAFKNVDPS